MSIDAIIRIFIVIFAISLFGILIIGSFEPVDGLIPDSSYICIFKPLKFENETVTGTVYIESRINETVYPEIHLQMYSSVTDWSFVAKVSDQLPMLKPYSSSEIPFEVAFPQWMQKGWKCRFRAVVKDDYNSTLGVSEEFGK